MAPTHLRLTVCNAVALLCRNPVRCHERDVSLHGRFSSVALPDLAGL